MTLPEFSEIFALLAVQLRFTDADEATIRGYYEALKTVEPELIALAAKRFSTTAEWFPKTSEWRELAARIQHERAEEQVAIIRKRRIAGLPPLCAECVDTGWRLDAFTSRYGRCDCREQRRLEVLGRRPMPTSPEGDVEEREPDPRVSAAIKQLAAAKGM